jgi:serine/threonine protein kinase
MLVDSENKPHTAAIDWYLLGVFVYEMLIGLPPFYSEDRRLMFDLIKHAKPKIP